MSVIRQCSLQRIQHNCQAALIHNEAYSKKRLKNLTHTATKILTNSRTKRRRQQRQRLWPPKVQNG